MQLLPSQRGYQFNSISCKFGRSRPHTYPWTNTISGCTGVLTTHTPMYMPNPHSGEGHPEYKDCQTIYTKPLICWPVTAGGTKSWEDPGIAGAALKGGLEPQVQAELADCLSKYFPLPLHSWEAHWDCGFKVERWKMSVIRFAIKIKHSL